VSVQPVALVATWAATYSGLDTLPSVDAREGHRDRQAQGQRRSDRRYRDRTRQDVVEQGDGGVWVGAGVGGNARRTCEVHKGIGVFVGGRQSSGSCLVDHRDLVFVEMGEGATWVKGKLQRERREHRLFLS
jgi:hypothetical protein